MEKLPINKVILLIILSLFLTEYLNPSVIGVRADYTPTPAGSPGAGNPNTPDKEAPSITPHFMVKVEPYRLGEILPSLELIPFFNSFIEQANLKEIFHPPAFTL